MSSVSAASSKVNNEIYNLMRQIINLPEGMPCSLCKTTYGRACVLDKIGEEMLFKGINIIKYNNST